MIPFTKIFSACQTLLTDILVMYCFIGSETKDSGQNIFYTYVIIFTTTHPYYLNFYYGPEKENFYNTSLQLYIILLVYKIFIIYLVNIQFILSTFISSYQESIYNNKYYVAVKLIMVYQVESQFCAYIYIYIFVLCTAMPNLHLNNVATV